MIYINFVINEKNEFEPIGHSIKPTTELSLRFTHKHGDTYDMQSLIAAHIDDEIKAKWQEQLPLLVQKSIDILDTIHPDELEKHMRNK